MQLIPAGQPLLLPNICVLCEAWPNPESGLPTIDTERDFEVGVITRLTGRKYICNGCGDDIARTFGFVSGAAYDSLHAELEERTARLARLEAASTALAQAQELQATLALLLPDIDSIAQDISDVAELTKPTNPNPPWVAPDAE